MGRVLLILFLMGKIPILFLLEKWPIFNIRLPPPWRVIFLRVFHARDIFLIRNVNGQHIMSNVVQNVAFSAFSAKF